MSNVEMLIMAGCILLMLLLLLASPVRIGIRLLLRAGAGAAGIVFANTALVLLNLVPIAAVGVNAFTLVVVALLGLPGFIIIYAASLIL